MPDPRRYLRKHPFLSSATLLVTPLLFACGDGGGKGEPDPDPPRAASITLSPDSIAFDAIGDTVRVTATVLDQYGDPFSGLNIVWASDNSTIASVDAGGVVKSLRDGETSVRAQAGTLRSAVHVEILQEAHALEILAGEDQFQWTGFLLRDTLKVRLVDGVGAAVVGEDVSWDVMEGEGEVFPEGPRTNSDGEVRALWVLGEGESGAQRLAVSAEGVDTVYFEATGSAPLTLLNQDPLTGTMLDTIRASILIRDSLGVLESGIPVEFTNITGFGEVVQGPTTSDINGELVVKWALGPTPGPQEVTIRRGDIGAELDLTADATGTLDPWPFTAVAPGFYHTCAIDDGGAAYCWGFNGTLQLAAPDTLPVERPVLTAAAFTWKKIGGGALHTCGLTDPGNQIYCWGGGFQTGQDGDGTQEVAEPALVSGGAWKSLTVGGYHNCGIKPDGSGWCWGAGGESQLGTGARDSIPDPALVDGGHLWIQMSAGHYHTCGIAESGAAYCWGRGAEGQLGAGVIEEQEAPALVAGSISWTKISAGRFHSCGISTTGEAFCWGEGGFNQLGTGSTADQTSPLKVSGGHRWSDIAAGQFHSCGVEQSGKLYCWGRAGFVGIGPFGSPTPVVVLPAYDWVSVRTQGLHTCAITVQEETYCWGPNESGQLGIGNTDPFNVPRMVLRGVIVP